MIYKKDKNNLTKIDINDERSVRLNHLSIIKEAGINPYPEKFYRRHTASQVNLMKDKNLLRTGEDVQISPKKTVSIAGRIITLRRHGKIIFSDIQDSTGRTQVCFKEDIIDKKHFSLLLNQIDSGDFIGITGEPFITKQGKLAVLCIKYVFLGKSLRPFPGKFYGFDDIEKRYRQRYLDTVINTDVFQSFIVRSRLVQGMREWLLKHKFIEINTRILQPQEGGAAAKPFKTHHNALDYDFVLRISPELDLKMAIIGGFERVFEFAINFRNEGIDPSHLQEFQMLEWYCAYENFERGMQWTEEILKYSVQRALGSSVFIVHDRKGNKCEINIGSDYRKIEFSELLKEYGIDIFSSKDELISLAIHNGFEKKEVMKRSRGNLLDDIYKKLIRPNIIQPTFITHYPSDLLPLARQNDFKPELADSYQLVIASWEIVKGYSELVDPISQRCSLEKQAQAREMGDDEAMIVNEEYLIAMEHGMPPVTGCGIGIDRLAALINGQKNLRDLVFFPLLKPEKDYDYI